MNVIHLFNKINRFIDYIMNVQINIVTALKRILQTNYNFLINS